MYQAMIFDFDGTLADTQELATLASQEAFRQEALQVPSAQEVAYYMGVPIEVSFLQMTNQEVPVEWIPRMMDTFRRVYAEHEQEAIHTFDGVVETLERLKAQGVRCFVLSSKRIEPLERNVHILALESYFEGLVGSDRVTHFKPHPAGVLQIIQEYDLNPATTLMVGDAIFDIQMGNAAGVDTCAVTWGAHDAEKLNSVHPTHIIERVQDLLTL